MAWAHAEAFRSPYCLAQSGMPTPDLAGLAPSDGELLAWPSQGALPAFETRVGELFGLPPERVLATVGGSGAMLVAAARWFGRGSTVLAERPRYQPLGALPRLFGARLLDLERTLERGWQVDAGEVARAARRAGGACHVLLTNPHNPSGALLDATTVAELARAVEPTGGVLVACEAYMEYARPEQRVHAALLAPNAVSIGTLTKAYGLGALRSGWMLLGEGLVGERAALVDRAYLAWIDPPSASLVAARRALDQLERLTLALRRVEAESRPHLVRWLERSRSVEGLVPPFGILSFPRVRGVPDTRALQRFLAAEWGVDVVAGEDFAAPGFLRVCCGVPEATLVEALARLEDGLSAWLERPRA